MICYNYDDYFYEKLKKRIDSALDNHKFERNDDNLFPESFLKKNEKSLFLKQQLHQMVGHVLQRAFQDLSCKNCVDTDKDDGTKILGVDIELLEKDGKKYMAQLKNAHNTDNGSSKRANTKALKESAAVNDAIPVYATIGKNSSGKNKTLYLDKKYGMYKTYGKGTFELFGVDYDATIIALKNAFAKIIAEREEWLRE